jgi:hypothetical protein
MNMFRKLCTISLVIATASSAIAQPRGRFRNLTPEQRVDHRVEMMKKHLAITDAQATQIAGVLREEQKTLAADREQVKAAPAEQKMLARTNLQKDRLAGKEQVLKSLTPDQLAKAEEIRKRHKQKMLEHRMFMREERMEGK